MCVVRMFDLLDLLDDRLWLFLLALFLLVCVVLRWQGERAGQQRRNQEHQPHGYLRNSMQ